MREESDKWGRSWGIKADPGSGLITLWDFQQNSRTLVASQITSWEAVSYNGISGVQIYMPGVSPWVHFYVPAQSFAKAHRVAAEREPGHGRNGEENEHKNQPDER